MVEGGLGGQGVEFVPGQVVADCHPLRSIGVVTALRDASVFLVAVAWAARSRAPAASAVAWAGIRARGARRW